MQSSQAIAIKEILAFTSTYNKFRRIAKFFKRWWFVLLAKNASDMPFGLALKAIWGPSDDQLRKAALLYVWKKIAEQLLFAGSISFRVMKIVFHPKLVLKRFILAACLQICWVATYRASKTLRHVYRRFFGNSRVHQLRSRLGKCTTYKEWVAIGKELDELTGREAWKNTKPSPYYDHRLIESKTQYCASLVESSDIEGVMWHLRKGLLRRQGGVGHEELYRRCYVGTKYLVSDYINTICDALRFVLDYDQPKEEHEEGEKQITADAESEEKDKQDVEKIQQSEEEREKEKEEGKDKTLRRSKDERGRPLYSRNRSSSGDLLPRHLHYRQDDGSSRITLIQKLHFFKETRHSLGRSALLLSGGITLGLYHLGVVKALYEQGLLPRVISGSSAGSIIAATLCTKRYNEIPEIFEIGFFDLNFFERIETLSKKSVFGSSFFRRAKRLFSSGTLLDINVLRDTIRANLGDMTFREAYERTGRILNISVTPRTKTEYPSILNYLTAPHVLIWSACLASCAIPLVFESVVLMAKDKSGNIEPYYPEGLKWADGSLEFDLPMNRLSELFNVNHFIVSQVNPHVIPFSTIGWSGNILLKLLHFIKSDLQNYWANLIAFGIPVPFFDRFFGVFTQKYTGDITIRPLKLTLRNFKGLLSNPTHEKVLEAILEGERKTWPFISMVKNHCDIEFTLDMCVSEVERRLMATTGDSPSSLKHSISMEFPFDEAKELTV